MTTEAVDVAVVGGGPAGALTAMLLARAGHGVMVLERAPRWRWRACGVFASPAAVTALRTLGIAEQDLARVARPIPAMEVVSRRGARFRMTYGGSGELSDSAVGFDRAALDPLLLDLAGAAGASVRVGAIAERLRLERGRTRIDVTAQTASDPGSPLPPASYGDRRLVPVQRSPSTSPRPVTRSGRAVSSLGAAPGWSASRTGTSGSRPFPAGA
jgi:menaquinone-9 beta-reductase